MSTSEVEEYILQDPMPPHLPVATSLLFVMKIARLYRA